jgi:hypothetical protein
MASLQYSKHRTKLCERWLILFSLDGKAHCMEQRYNSGSLALISDSRFAAGCLCRLRLAESRSWQVWTPLRESRNVVHPWQHAAINADFDAATCRTCWEVLNASVDDLLR